MMHHKNLKIPTGTTFYLQDNDFGFNILTEKNDKVVSTGDGDLGYTIDAQILQSILEYSINFGTEQYFKSRELSKNHLLINCTYYVLHYEHSHINKPNRPDNMNPKVVDLLEKLTDLELMESEPVESKNHEETNEYRFTDLGRVIAFLLKCAKNKLIDTTTTEQVYNQIYDFYNSLGNSHSIMCLIFLAHCRHNNELTFILKYVIGLLFNASSDIYRFLDKIKFLNMVFIDLRMWRIFETSLNYLSHKNQHIYELFLFHLKLRMEETMVSKSRKLKDYEIARLDKSQDLDTVVLEGYCPNCKGFSIKSMNIINYLREYVQSRAWLRNYSYALCPNCIKGYLHFEQILDSQSSLQYFDNTFLNEKKSDEEHLIKKIFDYSEKDNTYTEEAQKYQWIIRFFNHHDNDEYNKITAVQEWVLKTGPNLFDIDSNDLPSINKKKTNSPFNRRLDNLITWNILETNTTKSTKDGKAREFKISPFGKILSPIMETILSANKDTSYNKLFDSWKSHLSEYHSSLDIFCMEYLDKCKKEGLFEEFVEYYIKSFKYGKDYGIRNINDSYLRK